MSIRAYNWILKMPIKPCGKKAVALVLADYCTDTGKSYPQMKTFCESTSLSAEAVKKNLDELCADKLIADTLRRVGENGETVVYQFNYEAEVKQPEKKKKVSKNPLLIEADKIYQVYPRKIGGTKALTSIAKQIKAYSYEIVMNGTELFAKAWTDSGKTDLAWCPIPMTFFNQERFLSDPSAWGLSTTKKAVIGTTYKDVLDFVKLKENDPSKVATWASGFFSEWRKRNWQRNGKEIDWQVELSAQIARWRAREG